MSNHAIERIFQRYGKEFTFWDIQNMIRAIRQGKCYVLDPTIEDRIIVLLHYNHLPMKLVYSPGISRKGCIVTALPLDVDEWNANLSQIPDVICERKKK
jgi:hypothetical protein